MTLNKLKTLITIWLNEVINGKVKIWQVGSGKIENRFYLTYNITSDDDSWRDKHASLYINTHEDINKNVTFFTIGFDGEIGETKYDNYKVSTVFPNGETECDNYEAITVYPNGEAEWLGGSKPGDTVISYKHFSKEDIIKLKHMFDNADEILQDWLEKHPKFDMDEAHAICITEVIFKERDNIEIRFVANNRIFNSENKLYIGFETVDENYNERNYVFKVTEKHIPIRYPWGLRYDKHTATPFQEYAYVATFHGYVRPTEEEIFNATFRWVVSENVIKTANREAGLT